jgi:hypothetical protein
LPDLEQNQPAVLSTLGLRLHNGLTRLVGKTKRLLHEAIRPLPAVVELLRDLTRSRDQLIAENALLRQKLIVASRKVKRPVFKPHERGLMVLLASIVRGWRDAVLLAKPEPILRWHREGFRLFWKLKSRKRKPAESKVSAEQRVTLEGDHFYVDLVFYNRLLRCFVLVDLKLGKLTHQDIGQMQMYVNFFDRFQRVEHEAKTIGIILCSDKNDAMVKITLPDDNEQILATRYQMYLPTKQELEAELARERDEAERVLRLTAEVPKGHGTS